VSDYVDDNLFGGWDSRVSDRDRQLEDDFYDRQAAAVQARLDRRDRDTPSGLCMYCRTNAALPADDFCVACAREVFGS
jgi:hypothetical protein